MRFIWITKQNKNQDSYTSCSERFGQYLKEVQMASSKIECEQRHETLPSGVLLRTFKSFLSSPSKVQSICFERCCCFLNLPLQFIYSCWWGLPLSSAKGLLQQQPGGRKQSTVHRVGLFWDSFVCSPSPGSPQPHRQPRSLPCFKGEGCKIRGLFI